MFRDKKDFVIYHPEYGVHLGHCMGFGFWSLMDSAGQTCACTFSSVEEARRYVQTWDTQVSGLRFVPVVPDFDGFASEEACRRAGLPGWVNENTPTCNLLAA